MPKRKLTFTSGCYYHVYNRGAFQKDVFHSEENYSYCARLLQKNSHRFPVSVMVYCLMPNHYHFLIRQNNDKGIPEFIGYTFNAYAQAINRFFNRHGPIFQGPFKAILVDKNEYLMHICRYIHLNPVKAGLVKKPEDWKFSNYRDWVEHEPSRELAAPWEVIQQPLFDPTVLNMYFKNGPQYQEFVEDVLKEPGGMCRYLLD